MLRAFGPGCPDQPIDAAKVASLPPGAIWLDLVAPTKEEEMLAEKLVGTNIPTREDLAEIEPSSRLYQLHGAAFMTMSVLFGIDEGLPASDPIGFILTSKHLVSIRYVEPRPFVMFADQVRADPELASDPNSLLIRLLDAIVDRLADEFEIAGKEIEAVSHRIFQRQGHLEGVPELRLEVLLRRIGKAQQLLAKLRETSVSSTRLLTFLGNTDALAQDETNHRHVSILIADTSALNDHSNFLGDNLTFLLDASLGLINLQQNDVMKVFSVFAVVFMPPTLIAGIYGMNFKHMPELNWVFGYPMAIGVILASAVIPYWYARRKGWL
ncbi:MAG: magnesium transporter CorA family protein [Sphingomicrobium sp.]